MQQAFTYPWLLLGLTALPILSLLTWRAGWKRQRELIQMGGLVSGVLLARRRPSRMLRLLTFAGLTFLVIGMAGPRWGRDWTQSAAPGRDLVAVVDLSRSMYAEAPSRVERARNALLDLADTLRVRGGYRVALIVFAGRARLVCPLTHDVEHFRECVLSIDPVVAPDESLGTGTRIGAGLTLAVEVFTEQATEGRSPRALDILLFSDGDDPARDGEFRTGIAQASTEKIPIHVVALGDTQQSYPIPVGRGWLTYKGKEVRTRLEEAPLREITRRTGGQYLQPGDRTLALGDHYLAIAANLSQEETPDVVATLRQRPGWFLWPALILLSLSVIIPAIPTRKWGGGV